ncbi:MAG: NAD-dependent epimerase/dehydratase family protein [Bacteroidales bacterium]|jgi:UDP-glucose 4-epimerase
MTKILITGADSFVGTNFRKFSKYKDIEEISLYKNKPEDIDFCKYDVVLHLAAIVHQTKKIPENIYFNINRDLCLQVAEQAKKAGIKQFVFLSSLKVYGEFIPDSELRSEDSKCFPDNAYGKSKYEAEIGLRKLEDDHFTVSIIRPPLVYGVGVKANMLNLVRLIKSFPILPFRNINNKRNIIYIENLVGFIERTIENRAPGVFIAKDEGALSTTELVGFLSKYLGRRVILFKLPNLIIRICAYFKPGIFTRLFGSFEFDNNNTKNQLKYSPKYSSEEGIKKWLSGV